jgi:prepilin-type N-terminal cleavage/methylation domain-containing protein
MTNDRAAHGRRAGFTLIEAMVTLSLLCFVVAVLGPLLLRVSRQSTSVTASQYRTAVMVTASSWAMTIRTDQLFATCTVDTTTAFRHTTCSSLTDTLPGLRRVRLVVTPDDSLVTAPDTLTLYRVNTQFTNPFNTP